MPIACGHQQTHDLRVTVPVGKRLTMSLKEELSDGMMNEGATASFVTAGDYRLHLRQLAGEQSDLPTLVFLHEGLGTIGVWGDVPHAVCHATGCPGVIYERPGYGASDPRPVPWPDNIFEQEAEIVLPALLDVLGIDRPVLIGHSDGGTIALLYAAAFPERVCGVVTLAAHVVLDELTFAGVSALERSWREGSLRAELERFHGAGVDPLFRGWSGFWLDPARRAWSMVDRLPRITCPVLAIQGADDEYGLPAQLDAIVAGVARPDAACSGPELRSRPASSGARRGPRAGDPLRAMAQSWVKCPAWRFLALCVFRPVEVVRQRDGEHPPGNVVLRATEVEARLHAARALDRELGLRKGFCIEFTFVPRLVWAEGDGDLVRGPSRYWRTSPDRTADSASGL
jgi:pimeloyl-ACP methyl ester carboxylesterase